MIYMTSKNGAQEPKVGRKGGRLYAILFQCIRIFLSFVFASAVGLFINLWLGQGNTRLKLKETK